MYVTVSTGLGGAVYADGRLLLGPDGTAGEIGHVTLLEGGPRCGCGGVGHLEAISSGSGLAGQARDCIVSTTAGVSISPFLAEREAVAPLTGRDVAEGELAGDSICTALMARARRAFAIACVGWVNTFNPERIVIGGTVAQRQGERWLEPARAEIAATGLRSPSARVQIVAAELGEDVGLVGAWPLVAERHGDPMWRAQRPAG
jgi:glucokinase